MALAGGKRAASRTSAAAGARPSLASSAATAEVTLLERNAV